MLTPTRRILFENSPYYYPFGNTGAENPLEDFNYRSLDEIKILFLGCGDLRNALKTVANNKKQKLHIHLNDWNPSIIARNILILKVISASDFDTNNEDDVAFLWDLWYNAEWPEATRQRFNSVLKELLDNALPENVIIAKSKYLQSLQAVWRSWNDYCSKTKSEAKLLMDKMHEERNISMSNGSRKLNPSLGSELDTSATSEAAINTFTFQLVCKFQGVQDSIKILVEKEACRYFSTGTCRLQSELQNVCVNPTLLDHTTYRWQVHYQLCPFDGYLPLTGKELDTSDDKGILIRTCQKILRGFVAEYKKRTDKVKIFFHLEDALEFCLSESTLSFDVIDCSNLADHVGLVNLINACEKKLMDTPEAVLYTESILWSSLAPSMLKYVEEALCCPLNMIPTIYGLRLATHVEFGSSKPLNLNQLTAHSFKLCWKKVLPFENVSLSPSPALTRCLDQLTQKCFAYSLQVKGNKPGEKCGMVCYSPFTFNYVVDSIAQRGGGDDCLKNLKIHQSDFPPTFSIARRTVQAWRNGQTISKLSVDIQINRLILSGRVTPIPRILLISFEKFWLIGKDINNSPLLSEPNIYVIDNCELKIKKTRDCEMETISVSFLLVPDHGLETHAVYIYDAWTGLPISFCENISKMRVEAFHQPYPWCSKGSPLPLANSNGLKVKNCLESEDFFVLQIVVECSSENISGLNVSTNQRLPCQSAHDVIISLSQPKSIKPLKLSFPYPILVNEIRATLRRKDRLINLVLKKAIYEPWPYEFHTQPSRWILLDSLKPWEDNNNAGRSLGHHLGSQFKLSDFKNLSLSNKSALNGVRQIIKSLFLSATVYGSGSGWKRQRRIFRHWKGINPMP